MAPPSVRTTVKTSLRAEAGSAETARRFVSDVLLSRGMDLQADVAARLTSELVADAVLCARSQLVLTMFLSSSCVRIEVLEVGEQPALRHCGRAEGAVPGRGLELVQALAGDWGSALAQGGKSVWFELNGQSDPVEELLPVKLLGVPAAAYVALNLHLDQLVDELQTVAGTGSWKQASVTDRLLRLISRNLDAQAAIRASSWAQAREATSEPGATVDIELRVPPSAVDADRELTELLEEADRMCAAGELLTLPAPPALVALRRWVSAELRSQLRLGRDPEPCPL